MSRTVVYCKKCITPSSRPRVTFDEHGVCNACLNAEQKKLIDWEARKNEFEEIFIKNRKSSSHWDCVVPWSGGKDSSAIAYKLKFEYGLNPLLVTFSPLIPNEVGMQNRESMIQAGFDHIMVRPNQKVLRHLSKRFFIERGNQKVAWDAGINAVPLQVAVNYKIPLVMYAEHGESEYGGKVLDKESMKKRDFTEVIEHIVGDDPRNWTDDVVNENDLNPYLYPNIEDIKKVGVTAYYFSYFFKWSMLENYHYIRDKIDFKVCPQGRTEGTFTNFDSLDDKTDNLYYYMQYIKFGFGRAARDASRLIHNNQMTREEGIRLALQFDHEFPHLFFRENLEYLGISEDEFHAVVDQHRNSEIWQIKNGVWELRVKPH